ncbi:hypothetical protein [Aquibacillus albus]|uniref:HEAT repeat domain-containing protein n=1 Tax=Aquibacillus albus TaxID=1168171 RepID=A0ABS2N3C6_9BACI|nr:hypothetical protein [Aquibacillus albus]MBM7572645.1 hypothetical protein [Aquibacillus albus]
MGNFYSVNSCKKVIVLTLSVTGWIIIAITLLWYVIVLFSVFYSQLSMNGLYVPEIVNETKSRLVLVFIWTLIVFLFNVGWIKYNNCLPHSKERYDRKTNQILYMHTNIPWSEAVISTIHAQNVLQEAEQIKNSLSVVQPHPNETISNLKKMEPQQLLNLAITLIKSDHLSKGVSILRIILEHPESSALVKQVARIKVSQCLVELGHESFATGLAE